MNSCRGPRTSPVASTSRFLAPPRPAPRPICVSAPAKRDITMKGGNSATTGPFAPLVRATRGVVGKKDFNKLRGKAISLHSQVIKEFCGTIGADAKQAQAVIRLAKKNGEWLGFLA